MTLCDLEGLDAEVSMEGNEVLTRGGEDVRERSREE